jgi:hypothetical protein
MMQDGLGERIAVSASKSVRERIVETNGRMRARASCGESHAQSRWTFESIPANDCVLPAIPADLRADRL